MSAAAGSATVALTAGTLAAGPGTTCTITVKRALGDSWHVRQHDRQCQRDADRHRQQRHRDARRRRAAFRAGHQVVQSGVGRRRRHLGDDDCSSPIRTRPRSLASRSPTTIRAALPTCRPGWSSPATPAAEPLTAANGGTSTALTGGRIPVAGCNIEINVTAALAGTYVNSTGTITEGNAVDNPGASGTLTTTTLTAPTASKAFAPATVQLGGASQMTITLTNPNAIAISNASFDDTYPAGIQNAASGVLASNSCGGAVNAPAGGTSAAFAGGTIPASASCAIVVNVVATAIGAQVNSTGAITSNNAASGASASGTLTVTPLTAPTRRRHSRRQRSMSAARRR